MNRKLVRSRISARARLGCLALSCLFASTALAQQSLRGFVVSHATEAPDSTGYGSSGSLTTLDEVVASGANCVLLSALGFQSAPDIPFIESSAGSDWSTSDLRLRRMIRAARARGLQVLLSPRLQLSEGAVADIQMRDEAAWDKWFEEYRRFVVHYAEMAEDEDIRGLVIGHGLDRAAMRRNDWRSLIKDVRRKFRGEVGYVASSLGTAESVDFWAELHWIGVALYESLGDADADAESLAATAGEVLQRAMRLAKREGRPVLIAEAGFRSVKGCHVAPWSQQRAAPDESAQAAAYQALLSAVSELEGEREFRGLLWNGLSSDPNAERRGSLRSFSPRGKAAMQLLVEAWRGLGVLPPVLVAGGRGYGGMVVSSDTLATRAGVEILRRGGNAVDAAIAAAFVMAVTYPEAGNLGGGGFLLAMESRGRPWAIDFREMAPLAAHEDLYVAWKLRGDSTASRDGVRAAGIPGTVAGLYEAWQRGGRLRWAELVEPARRLAEQGFVVGDKLPANLELYRARLLGSSMSRSVFYRGDKKAPDGLRPVRRGELLVQPELARVLTAIAEDGERAFYRGPIAQALVDEVEAAGGIWTTEDLRRYRPRTLTPVEIPLDRRRTLITLPPPSSGSVVLGQAMYFLERQRAERMELDGPERARALIESLRLAFADRNVHLGDPAVMRVQPQELLRPSYLRRRARMLPRFGPGSSERVAAGEPANEGFETTHLVVFDAEGRCVSLTTTLNSLFGCGWTSPSTGILLNNEMDDFDTQPGEGNLYGLVGSGVNRVRPGVRMLSSMAPCIVSDSGDPWLAMGARGGPRILSSILQVLMHRLWDEMPLGEAVAAPRLHHQWVPDLVELEADRQWPGLWEQLVEEGYLVKEMPRTGKLHAAERMGDGSFLGVPDPREHGLAMSPR